LITIKNNTEGVPTVNARELHAYLESKRDFSTWIKSRINKYNLIEEVDYHLLHEKMEQVSGAKYLTEYYLTLRAAKKIAMRENKQKGVEVADYFLDVEERYHRIREQQLEQQIKDIKSKKISVDTRNFFTDAIKDNMKCPTQGAYIAATLTTKFSLNIPVNKSKEQYTETERNLTTAAEFIALERIKAQNKKLNQTEINNVILIVGSEVIANVGIERNNLFYDESLSKDKNERQMLVDIVHRISSIIQKPIEETWSTEVYALINKKFNINVYVELEKLKNKSAIYLDIIMSKTLKSSDGQTVSLALWLVRYLCRKYTDLSQRETPLKISDSKKLILY